MTDMNKAAEQTHNAIMQLDEAVGEIVKDFPQAEAIQNVVNALITEWEHDLQVCKRMDEDGNLQLGGKECMMEFGQQTYQLASQIGNLINNIKDIDPEIYAEARQALQNLKTDLLNTANDALERAKIDTTLTTGPYVDIQDRVQNSIEANEEGLRAKTQWGIGPDLGPGNP